MREFLKKVDLIVENKLYIDSKSKLQEVTQEKYKKMPLYKLISEEGPDHDKTFNISVYVGKSLFGKGAGKTKQQAQQEAAQQALLEIEAQEQRTIQI